VRFVWGQRHQDPVIDSLHPLWYSGASARRTGRAGGEHAESIGIAPGMVEVFPAGAGHVRSERTCFSFPTGLQHPGHVRERVLAAIRRRKARAALHGHERVIGGLPQTARRCNVTLST
jgi:hypothetical protein